MPLAAGESVESRRPQGGENPNAPLTWRCGSRKRDDLQVLVRKTIRIAPDGRGGKTVTANKHRDQACHGSVLVADRFDRDFGSKLKLVDLTLDEGNGR